MSDGRYWDFYLSMADGPPVERRFHRLELRDEDRVPEYAEVLETWLCKRQVASGEARRSAEDRLEGDRSRMRAREAMPEAWNVLLSEPDGLLCDLLADKVKGEVGVHTSTIRCRGIPAEASECTPIVDARSSAADAAMGTPGRTRAAFRG